MASVRVPYQSTGVDVKALILVLLLAFGSVHAADLEVGIGQAYAQKAEDGIWYQERFPHTLRLQGEFHSLGLVGNTSIFGRDTRWRVYGVFIGGFAGSADAVQDEQYAPSLPSGCVPAGCGTFSRYQSSLSTRGMAATLAPGFRPFSVLGRPVIVSPEVGIHAYIPKLDVDVYTLDSNSPSSSHRAYQYAFGANVGEVFGAGVAYGPVRLSVMRYKINMKSKSTSYLDEVPSSVGELVNVVQLSVIVPFK